MGQMKLTRIRLGPAKQCSDHGFPAAAVALPRLNEGARTWGLMPVTRHNCHGPSPEATRSPGPAAAAGSRRQPEPEGWSRSEVTAVSR